MCADSGADSTIDVQHCRVTSYKDKNEAIEAHYDRAAKVKSDPYKQDSKDYRRRGNERAQE